MEIITKNAEETKNLGREIASQLTGGEVIALKGELGAGKTTFVQGLAEHFGLGERIVSPTFILLREYNLENHNSIKKLYHIDLYRLDDDLNRQVRELGIEDFWKGNENILLIEWAEKAKDILPSKTKWIEFEVINSERRKIKIYET